MELIAKVLDRQNIEKALKKVVSNKGTKGVDGVTIDELKPYMEMNWERIKQEVQMGSYQPQSVLGVEIRKPKGGTRLLGIPTVIDRLIQQAIHQVLNPIFDVEFSEFSYGFRKGRSVHDAVIQSKRYLEKGYKDIIDLDLKSFFDIVNHDYLMSLLNHKIKDRMLMKLIRKYLKSNIMIGGLVQQREKGTPQGSPLSPLLSNILLNNLDKELEKRGHKFVRYADDCSIFVKSEAAAARVLKSITNFIEEKLHLKVNEQKTKICKPLTYFTLGFGFYHSYKKGDKGKFCLKVSPDNWKRMKQKIREITRKTLPISLNERMKRLRAFVVGWLNYYKYVALNLRDLDSWVRKRIRYAIWKQWKKPNKRWRSFIRLGIERGRAYSWSRSRLGGWRIAQSPMMKTTVTLERLEKRGYLSFTKQFAKCRRSIPNEVQLKFSYI